VAARRGGVVLRGARGGGAEDVSVARGGMRADPGLLCFFLTRDPGLLDG
jgi:hypothetical protein